MSDAHEHQAAGAGELTEEQLRASLEQLRNADVAEILAQAFNLLGTGAEVKLGRPDARVLIDALSAMVNAAEGGLPDPLVAQMHEGLSNLQVAQVQAERDQAEGGTQADDRAATTPAGEQDRTAATGTEQGGGQSGQKMTDRLWIPGREPEP